MKRITRILLGAVSLLVFISCIVAATKDDNSDPFLKSINYTLDEYIRECVAANTRYHKSIEPYIKGRNKSLKNAHKKARIKLEKVKKAAERVGSVTADVAQNALEELEKLVIKTEEEVNTLPRMKDLKPAVVRYEGHSYLFIISHLTAPEAKRRCEQMGGHLVYIETHEERRFLNEQSRNCAFWVGGTDQHKEQDWRWLNGKPIDKTMWITNHPMLSRDRNYVILTSKGMEAASSGYKPLGYICEWEK